MNTRCYRCGWSFSLSREAMEEAAVSSVGQKAHVIHCPRCRQAIRVPMDQILHALPPGWAPGKLSGEPVPAAEAVAPITAVAATSLAPDSEPAAAADETPKRAERRHRRSSKTHSGDSAAVPAAKNSNPPN